MMEGPYKLPYGWRWVRLGDVADKPQYGYTQTAIPERMGPRFLRISDIQEGSVNWDQVPYCRCDDRAFAKYKLEPGDILFARSGATTGKTFLVERTPYDVVFASYLIRLRAKEDFLLKDYAFRFFQSPRYWDQIKARGAAQPNMNARALQQLFLPLPPLEEQLRIVAKTNSLLERIREARRIRAAARLDAELLMQSVLAETFPTSGSPLPEGWRWESLGEACEINPRRPSLKRLDHALTSFIPMTAVDEVTGSIKKTEARNYEEVRRGYTGLNPLD
jgi:type I restriction enzyme S subunit